MSYDSGPPVLVESSGTDFGMGGRRVEGVTMVTGGDEHGILTGKNVEGLGLKVGDTVRLIPGHIDPTVNMHEFLMVVDGGEGEGQGEEPKVVEIWPISGRGAGL